MQSAEERNQDTLPVGSLGIIAMDSCRDLGEKINRYIVSWRNEREHEHKGTPQLLEYAKDNYLIKTATPRFGTGEAKGVIYESVRGDDIYILVDVNMIGFLIRDKYIGYYLNLIGFLFVLKNGIPNTFGFPFIKLE